MTVYVDTAVVMYAAGQDHPLREPARHVLERVGDGTLDAVISAEVVREILHRFAATDSYEVGVRMARSALDLFAPVLPVTHDIMRRTVALVAQHPALPARDLVHAAACAASGITVILSPDAHFDEVPGLTRAAPEAWSQVS